MNHSVIPDRSPDSRRNINGIDILLQGLNYSAGKKKGILTDVFGAAAQGDMLAVMGPTGSGKTSLLNCIAGRVPLDSGEILANGLRFTKATRRHMCYVQQDDMFFPWLTLRETLTYAALLRLPDKMPWQQKKARIDEIIEVLDLTKCQNTIIGGPMIRGLSGGEKKRTNIACELLTNPALMLMDEPTSGLDSSTALSLTKTIKRYTHKSNKTVIIVIHQPSSQIFYTFNKILLLCEGKVAYYGTTNEIIDFFDNIGLRCEPHFNPADFILAKVKSEESVKETITEAGGAIERSNMWQGEILAFGHGARARPMGDRGVGDTTSTTGVMNEGFLLEETPKHVEGIWPKDPVENLPPTLKNGSADLESVTVRIPGRDAVISDIDKYYDGSLKFQSSFWTQFRVLFKRSIKHTRKRLLTPAYILQEVIANVMMGIIWFQLRRTEDQLREREAVLQMLGIWWGFNTILDPIFSYVSQQSVVLKERASGWYRLSAYFLSSWLSELLLTLILPTVTLIFVYWAVGLKDVGGFFGVLGVQSLGIMTTLSIGHLIIVAFDNPANAASLSQVIMFTNLLACGFLARDIPYWADWIQYVSFMKYQLDSSLLIEFTDGFPIRCGNSTTIFPACLAPNVTSVPSESLLTRKEIMFGHIFLPVWANILILLCFVLLTRIAAYLALRFWRGPKHHS